MGVKMTATKHFRGVAGEGRDGGRIVEDGDEFTARDDSRAQYLERMGFALPLPRAQPRTAAVTPAAENKAAEAGPLVSAGGGTGAATPPSSSPRARARGTRTSRAPKAKPGS